MYFLNLGVKGLSHSQITPLPPPRSTGKVTAPKLGCGILGGYGNSTRRRRIVGGKISNQGAWPWQAAINVNSNGEDTLKRLSFRLREYTELDVALCSSPK